ncbi:MAG: hypothetical protein HAW67_04130, partial [Endozoicomonadaceae bacterium]|nr:hypothetical protein [Endozoicomonadaceae bacterium]
MNNSRDYKLSTFMENNAFNILGLATSVTNQEIRMRHKEIEAWLKQDEVPEYEVDSKDFTSQRSLELVSEAFRRLDTKKYMPRERFFWFNFTQETEPSYKLFNTGKNKELTQLLDSIKPSQDLDIFHKNKNIALLKTLMLTSVHNKLDILESLRAWEIVIKDNIGWKSLMHEYTQVDDLIDKILFDSFREKITDEIAYIYATFS